MSSYLDAVDAQQWPGIATVPRVKFAGMRARRAEAEFAQAAETAGLVLDGDTPDLTVKEEALFTRLAAHGWVGLAESYMAGEWETPDHDGLATVLAKLLESNFAPKTPVVPVEADIGGELPANLVRLYAGDEVSHQPGLYATGVPTTVRESFPTYVSGPKSHFVDITSLSDPNAVDRDDLGSAQVRAAEWLADAARVGAGSHVLVFPASGAQAAIQAGARRAVVDVVTADADTRVALEEYLVLEGANGNVDVQLVDQAIPGPRQWRGRYDAIISVDKLAVLVPAQRKLFAKNMDRLLGPNGRLVIESPVATEKMTSSGADALMALRAYVWPGLDLPSVPDVHKLLERDANLRVVAQVHTGNHAMESLAQQRSFFGGRLREAAAAGFDPVYRRLWMYQFALREALLRTGQVDSVQFTAVRRHRGGQR
ncbi:cyclopropane-fatty-acyl-phospholipid synthase [Corynebacterium phocae]|uniref:Cyclopropane-fatty-acyl-phospholipid synthase n=1 Tax=Corynebacterium phocae TaxID=161895 RepID=A0A1L7D342_9CORY|nr:class I SAM-dependent methyltransferase [Corynebacterium phocae]APT92544.1 cyclopropane-fatty-acyl-phospholipid synthase [Corynebacterium phocae]KAA8725146.1 SAM-dependent methyltransferase [Corynebacterium phocae]